MCKRKHTVFCCAAAQALEHTAATLQKDLAAELLTGSSLQLQIDLAAADPSHSASEGGSVAARRLMKRNIQTRPETPRVEEVSSFTLVHYAQGSATHKNCNSELRMGVASKLF